VAGEAPFRDALGGHTHAGRAVRPPEEYALLLERLGYAEQHVRLQVYGHRLAARDEVFEWVKGSLLTDYQRRLPPALYARFVARAPRPCRRGPAPHRPARRRPPRRPGCRQRRAARWRRSRSRRGSPAAGSRARPAWRRASRP